MLDWITENKININDVAYKCIVEQGRLDILKKVKKIWM